MLGMARNRGREIPEKPFEVGENENIRIWKGSSERGKDCQQWSCLFNSGLG